MKRVASSRSCLVDLLRRRPALEPETLSAAAPEAVRRVDQLRALLRLVERGVLSADEFERHEANVFRRSPRT